MRSEGLAYLAILGILVVGLVAPTSGRWHGCPIVSHSFMLFQFFQSLLSIHHCSLLTVLSVLQFRRFLRFLLFTRICYDVKLDFE